MKKTDTLTMLYNHHLWANLRLMNHCVSLSDEQLDTSIEGTFGTIRDTLKHLVLSEKGYFSRISTGQRYDHPKAAVPMTLAEMIELAQETGTGIIEWANRVEANDIVTIDWDGTPRNVPKTILLTQMINHATEHRAQIMVIMTQLGIEPPSLDSWTYFDEMDQGD